MNQWEKMHTKQKMTMECLQTGKKDFISVPIVESLSMNVTGLMMTQKNTVALFVKILMQRRNKKDNMNELRKILDKFGTYYTVISEKEIAIPMNLEEAKTTPFLSLKGLSKKDILLYEIYVHVEEDINGELNWTAGVYDLP